MFLDVFLLVFKVLSCHVMLLWNSPWPSTAKTSDEVTDSEHVTQLFSYSYEIQENCLSSQQHRTDAWRAARWRWRDGSWTLGQKHLHHNIHHRSLAECQCGLNPDAWRSPSGFKTTGHDRTLVTLSLMSSCCVISFSSVLTGGLAPPAVRLHHPLKLTCGWNHMKLVFHWWY